MNKKDKLRGIIVPLPTPTKENYEIDYDRLKEHIKWLISQDLVEGKAVLCGAFYNGKYVGFALINIYKEGAYYSSASEDPDAETPVPALHIIQWRVVNWLKEKGFIIYEVGLQQFSPQLFNFPSEKDITISFFKRGFGGVTTPVFSGEKYYSKELLFKTLLNRIEKFKNTSSLKIL